ncbi:MAG: sucrase ferredoxin [Gaiella sp.]
MTTCSDASLALCEPLAGTATHARRFLLVEVAGAWGRDPVADTPLPSGVKEVLEGFDGRVLFIRRPGAGKGTQVFLAELDERHPSGGTLAGLRVPHLADLADVELGDLLPAAGPLVVVCTHGKRDACCSRLGTSLFTALAPHVAAERLWQSSHQGGHRFAPCVVVLPHGTQFGRVDPAAAEAFAATVDAGLIPLDAYRGRVVLEAPAQAAEVAIRLKQGWRTLDGITLLPGDPLRFQTPSGIVTAAVEQMDGVPQPASCGADLAAQPRFDVRLL